MEEGNVSLTYTAPKQPKKNRPESAASSATDSTGKLGIIVVQAVQTYKLEGDSYANQGKLGAAVLGNTASKLYQLLLYKTKQQHVTTTKITDKFQFTVQAQNFASFYDDNGQNWSIMFESETNAAEFARVVGIARACAQSETGQQPFYMQELKVGEGTGAELGDLLNIRYTTLPLVQDKIEKAIESNLDAERPQRVCVRRGVWEEALVGAMTGSKRLIVLDPILFGPWKPLADPSNRLVVEVEIGRIKSRRQSQENSPLVLLNLPDSSESNVDSSTDETSIKARGASISEALTNSPKTHKASIISRMARMGQATLPLKGAIVCNPSDSEETEEETSGVPVPGTTSVPLKSILKPRSLSGKRSTVSARVSTSSAASSQTNEVASTTAGGSAYSLTSTTTAPAQQVTVYQPPLGWPPQNQPAQYLLNGVPINFAHPEGQMFTPSHHQVVPLPTVVSTPSVTPPSETHLSVFLSESRTHNAEVRMGLTKVADKVDSIIGKIDSLQQPLSSGVLEPRTLLASIQKLVLENEQLNSELADRRVKMEQQNEKIYQLLQQKIMEQNSAAAPSDQQPDAPLQVLMLGLQQEKAKLGSDLNDALAKMNTLQSQSSNYERLCIEMKEEVRNLTARLQTAYVDLECSKQALLEQEDLVRCFKQKTDASTNLHNTQDSVINGLHRKVEELQAAKTLLENALIETKQLLKFTENKMSEEKSLMQNVHKEEIMRLEQIYKDQLDEALRNNVNCSENSCHHLSDLNKLAKENEELRNNISELSTRLSTTETSSTEDIKKVMNVMFKLLKSEFVPGTSYDGAVIRDTMLSSIQNVTLQYMKMKAGAKDKTNSSQGVTNEEVRVTSKPGEQLTSTDKENTNGSIKSESIQEPVNSSINISDSKREETKRSADIQEKEGKIIENKGNEAKETTPKVVEPESETKPDNEIPQIDQQKSSEEKSDNENSKDQSLGADLEVVKPRESSVERGWRPQPPPSPLFDDEEDDDDWLS